ncbi:glycosyltransferase family 2 protein [Sphingobacterium paramultivorum]|uniref:Glycosyltransferase family 2 protein n=1 Tax=Sphingobacterium paramultivorum TaxID=2886510 RepID=A0A7G5E7Z4_9SPHI|nr:MULTISPECIES: glycosyltransferase family 2 protein [Sphingobacterium]QMV70119.1 glycosyltransferase family 2 protein [Sphingobacterium paramultivorum]WSO13957.1 glycosyltransferase family 2 protein [Sphingobacterium paramultivorum]
MARILTIIVSYNFEPWIHKCLPSLLDSSHPTDILVVDNNSGDNTTQIIKETYPTIRLIESSENLGFGKANNIGLDIVLKEEYDYAFLVNQDAWLDQDCIANLVKINADNIGIISPIHYDGTETTLDHGFAVYTKNATNENSYRICSFVNAAFWFIPNPVIRKVGGFAPIFFHYGEDKDYANRIKYYGLNIILADRAKAYHDRQQRKTDRKAFLKSEFVYHLTEYCNINYTFVRSFSMAILASLKKMGASIFKGHIFEAKSYLNIAFRLLGKSGAVYRTRLSNKKAYNKIY